MSAVFNRNIITKDDIDNVKAAVIAGRPERIPKALTDRPPAGASNPAAAAGTAPGNVPVPTEDDFMTRLLKFVPLEVVGFYILLAGVIDSNASSKPSHAVWLASLLIGTLVITLAYDYRILGVERRGQVIMSVIGIAVYAFSTGGWFATTNWWHAWYGSIAVPLFVMLAAIIRLRPLILQP
jgi:hypothetical protein